MALASSNKIIMEYQLAPLAIFTYKRLDTLKNLIESLYKCDSVSKTALYIFSDGAKKAEDVEQINKVRDFIKQIKGFESIKLEFSDVNRGLAKSVMSGVSKVIQEHDKIIVLEDDLIVTPNFLLFMNQALNKYSSNKEVFSVSGYSFDLKKIDNYDYDAYFLNRGWSWGWSTWKDRWGEIDWDVKSYDDFKSDQELRRKFNKGGSDLSSMLSNQMEGKIDSWAIRWFYHQFKINGLTVYPVYSKVLNMGFDQFATHTKGSGNRYTPKISQTEKKDFRFPEELQVDKYYQKCFQRKMGIMARVGSKITTIFSKYIKTN
ncbi:MAG: sugar transferase [Mucilaginibacter sp.]|nr:sugar transferase [Mucilaginibacter sp.]